MSGQGSPPGPRRSRGTARTAPQDSPKPDAEQPDGADQDDGSAAGTPVAAPAGAGSITGGAGAGGSGGGRRGPGRPATAGRPSGFFFNTWLDRGLHELYDVVASEPIPDALLKLLDEGPREGKDAPPEEAAPKRGSVGDVSVEGGGDTPPGVDAPPHAGPGGEGGE